MRVCLGFAGLMLLAGCSESVPEQGHDHADYSLVSNEIGAAKSFVLYEGLPSDFESPELYESEKKTKASVEFLGSVFYKDPLKVRPADVERLKAIFADKGTFVPYEGPKTCGGFHADYAIEWHSGSERYYTLICFTCHEMASEKAGQRVLCDISDEGYSKLQEVLGKYKVNVPTVEFSGLWSMHSGLVESEAAFVYRGLPRGVKPGPSSLRLHGYDFGKVRKTLTAEDKKALESFFLKSGFISPHEPKKCVFHPDFAVEWHVNDTYQRMLVCLGCSEVKFFDVGIDEDIHYDLTPEGAQFMTSFLNEYR